MHPVARGTFVVVRFCGVCEQVAEELTAKDVIKAHARDELGIDLDEMSNPWQVSLDKHQQFSKISDAS